MDHEIVRYLMEIQDRLGTIEAKLDDHVERSAKRDAKVEHLDKKVVKAEASLKTLRWIGGALLITLPTSLAAVAKILKP